jgi:hypothetical protein
MPRADPSAAASLAEAVGAALGVADVVAQADAARTIGKAVRSGNIFMDSSQEGQDKALTPLERFCCPSAPICHRSFDKPSQEA